MNNVNVMVAVALLALIAPMPAQGLDSGKVCNDLINAPDFQCPQVPQDQECDGRSVAGVACLDTRVLKPQPAECDEGDTRVGPACVSPAGCEYSSTSQVAGQCLDLDNVLGSAQDLLGGGGHHPCEVKGYTKDDDGFGGTHATCYYACMKLDLLGIEVRSMDTKFGTPDVSGYTDCGGAYADCPKTTRVCHGAGGPANSDESDQGCVGRSYEINSSPITITCVAAGRGVICELTGLQCPRLAASAAVVCRQQNPGAGDVLDSLLAPITGPVTSFVTFQFAAIEGNVQGFSVEFDGTDPEHPLCWAGPF